MTVQPCDTGKGILKGQVIYRILGRDRNQRLLETIPHIPYLDLAVVFYSYIRIPEYGSFVMQINREQMKEYGESPQDLYQQARQNTPVLLPCKFSSLMEIVHETYPFLLSPSGKDLYVLTNEDQRFGAAALLYEGQLSRVGRRLKENFYVLPSSVHETIIVPASEALDIKDMREIVREVNGSFVKQEEVLSDAVYYYDCQTGTLGQV